MRLGVLELSRRPISDSDEHRLLAKTILRMQAAIEAQKVQQRQILELFAGQQKSINQMALLIGSVVSVRQHDGGIQA